MFISSYDNEFKGDKLLTRGYMNEEILSGKQVVIYGAGMEGIRTLMELRQNDIDPICFIDADSTKHGNEIGGVKIHPIEKLDDFDKDTAIIVTPIWYLLRVTRSLQALGFFNLFYRSFDPGKWDRQLSHNKKRDEIIKNGKDKIDFVKSKLHDQKSIDVFDAAVYARANADSTKLEPLIDQFEYYPKDVPGYIMKRNEVFVDCGAYDGSGIVEFISMANNNYKHVYAFELDPVNLALTKSTLEYLEIEDVSLYGMGLSDCSKEAMYISSTCSSRISEKGDIPVHLDSIDNVLYDAEHRPTFIKMDLEGAEPEVLIGAKKVIERDHPKLAICIYHFPINQLWDIPYYMMKTHPDYKYYIRQHAIYPNTVFYAL